MADPKANDKQGYHRFQGEEYHEHGSGDYGSFEVFWEAADIVVTNAEGEVVKPGWYWWACFPGCMPDGEAIGPFATSQEAYNNAQEGA